MILKLATILNSPSSRFNPRTSNFNTWTVLPFGKENKKNKLKRHHYQEKLSESAF